MYVFQGTSALVNISYEFASLEACINKNTLRAEQNLIKFGKSEGCSLLRTQAGRKRQEAIEGNAQNQVHVQSQ